VSGVVSPFLLSLHAPVFCFGGVLAMDFDFAAVEFLRTRPDLIGDMAFAVTVERAVEADGSLQVWKLESIPSFLFPSPSIPFHSFPFLWRILS
jgi:hypothetical protein